MTETSIRPYASNAVSIFGPAPILEGEDEHAYNELLKHVSGSVKPTNIIEEIWTREIADHRWEIFRWRRLKTARLSEAVSGSLSNRLAGIMRRKPKKTRENLGTGLSLTPPVPPSARRLMKKWAARDPIAVDRVREIMKRSNLTMDQVIADAFFKRLDEIERIDGLIAVAEARCNSIFREIDRHRTGSARHSRAIPNDVEDAEFEIVAPARA